MKRKTYDWLLRFMYFDSLGNRAIKEVKFYDMTKSQMLEIAERYSKDYASVRVYKLEIML